MDFFILQVGLILIAMDGAISMVDDFLLKSDSLMAGKLFRMVSHNVQITDHAD